MSLNKKTRQKEAEKAEKVESNYKEKAKFK